MEKRNWLKEIGKAVLFFGGILIIIHRDKVFNFLRDKDNIEDIKNIFKTLTENIRSLKTEKTEMLTLQKQPVFQPVISPQYQFSWQKPKEIASTMQSMPKIDTSEEDKKTSTFLPGIKEIYDDWLKVLKHPFRCVILGEMGSGKSATGHFLLEMFHYSRPVCIMGFPQDKISLLPSWITVIDSLDEIPPDAVCLIDEAYIEFYSKDFQDKNLVETLSLVRHKNTSLIFIAQQSRLLNINIISLCDAIIIKEPGLFTGMFERSEVKNIIQKAQKLFNEINERDRKKYSYTVSGKFEGMLENFLPSYWTGEISKAYGSFFTPGKRKGKDLTKKEKKDKAKQLYSQGYSYKKIARIFGVSKATIINWVKHSR